MLFARCESAHAAQTVSSFIFYNFINPLRFWKQSWRSLIQIGSGRDIVLLRVSSGSMRFARGSFEDNVLGFISFRKKTACSVFAPLCGLFADRASTAQTASHARFRHSFPVNAYFITRVRVLCH